MSNGLLTSLTFSRAKKNRALYHQTDLKCFEKLNFVLAVPVPAAAVVLGFVLGNENEKVLLMFLVLALVSWIVNPILVGIKFKDSGEVSRAVRGVLGSGFLCFWGLVLIPLIKLIGAGMRFATALQGGNFRTANYESSKGMSEASAVHRHNFFVKELLDYSDDYSGILAGFKPAWNYDANLESDVAWEKYGYASTLDAVETGGLTFDQLNDYDQL